MQVQLKVNGKPVAVDVPPHTLLVQVLREHLKLTGTHVGCDTAQCGDLPQAGTAGAQHGHHALHFRLLEHEAFNLLHHRAGALLRGARGQLHVHQHGALVFIGQERRGQTLVDHNGRADDGHINNQNSALRAAACAPRRAHSPWRCAQSHG